MEPCCEPLCCEPLSESSASTMAARLKALSDPNRLRLFSMISSSGEQCACDLTEPLGIGQPTVSHHLKVLHDAGLVTRVQRGKWAFYSVQPGALRELSMFLDPSALVS
ncbi:MAG: metalloregulator ArsR/SmtB family transcription factor [Actinomycetota bacterium]|nr:metalloregulator ArsR/SmtB family transcription factor [Actinomycetota bacterium]